MNALGVETAPAKVNLALHVTGRQPDGFHSLESLVVFAEVGDDLSMCEAKADGLKLTGPFAAQITPGQSNLVARAVKAFRARWPEVLPDGLEFTLTKNLPVSAGIGGGSADAAAALRLLARHFGANIEFSALSELALDLGADVPACLLSETCRVSGVGQNIEPVRDFPACHLLLVNPLKPIATADIFRGLKSRDNPPLPPLPDPPGPISMLGLWLQGTRNDLQQTAIELLPEVADLVAALSATPGSIIARMSGSGATVFSLYASGALAHQAAHDMREKFPNFWVTAAPVLTG